MPPLFYLLMISLSTPTSKDNSHSSLNQVLTRLGFHETCQPLASLYLIPIANNNSLSILQATAVDTPL